jgi:hypothetical protein
MVVETVKIVADNEQGFIIINAVDYDETIHCLYQYPPIKSGARKK